MHHHSVTRRTFDAICADPRVDRAEVQAFVKRNFADRYSPRWHLSRRTFRGAEQFDKAELVTRLGLDPAKPIATIYSHVFYDTLYFFEREIYADYAEWFLKSVAYALENSHVNWLVKIHPSNVWRCEIKDESEYEESKLIRSHFGELPNHLQVLNPSAGVHPLTLIEQGDFGVTVRGTIGMEMPCFGNRVVTAAEGRYSGLGFTIDPQTDDEYGHTLLHLHELPDMTDEQIRRAELFYYTIFKLKPYAIPQLEITKRMGSGEVNSAADLFLLPRRRVDLRADRCWPEIESFASWAEIPDAIDYLDGWEQYAPSVVAAVQA